jgi:predicted RNase H-like HicB family nuclease
VGDDAAFITRLARDAHLQGDGHVEWFQRISKAMSRRSFDASGPTAKFRPLSGSINRFANWVDSGYCDRMEHIVNLHIEKLPEGVYLATSDDVPGLVAQGRTIAETIEIARDVAKKLIEAQGGDADKTTLSPVQEEFDYPLLLGL